VGHADDEEATMATAPNQEPGAVVEVRVYKGGQLADSRVCESEEDARALMAHWAEAGDVEFEVDDLSTTHWPGDILEPDPPSTRPDESSPQA
jgi:hypothetical protein